MDALKHLCGLQWELQTVNVLDLVSPILTSAERKTYSSLLPAEQDRFEKEFWTGKTISSQEYFDRVQCIDTVFGSGKPGSGANTD